MTPEQRLLHTLAIPADSKIVLLILDGVGDLRTAEQPRTALELAPTPNLDALAETGSSGRLIPVAPGITPGSGPGHLALFGYDPRQPEHDIGRGVLEALGLGIEFDDTDVLARGNFATADDEGLLTDRRAGRIPTEKNRELCATVNETLAATDRAATVHSGEGHRFVLRLTGADLDPRVRETDPQRLGVAPVRAEALAAEAETTADRVREVVDIAEATLRDQPQANRIILRGFSQRPCLTQLPDLFGARFGAFAGYPLYRGVAAACGMADVAASKRPAELFADVAERWSDFDFFFVHVKETDQAGEDGDLAAKVSVLEEVDQALPTLTDLAPDVLAVTADHSTPAPMRGHSWHPVPLVIAGARAFVDDVTRFDEASAIAGHLGQLRSTALMGLLFAHAGRLAKFGA